MDLLDRIAPPERIALLHGGPWRERSPESDLSVSRPTASATRIEMRTVFPATELRDEAVEQYHSIEGGRCGPLGNLAAYVTEIVRQGS